MVQEEFNTIS